EHRVRIVHQLKWLSTVLIERVRDRDGDKHTLHADIDDVLDEVADGPGEAELRYIIVGDDAHGGQVTKLLPGERRGTLRDLTEWAHGLLHLPCSVTVQQDPDEQRPEEPL